MDHIIPKTAQGPTRADNLAFACVSCSLRKEARRSAVDPRAVARSDYSTRAASDGTTTFVGRAFVSWDGLYGAGDCLRSAQ